MDIDIPETTAFSIENISLSSGSTSSSLPNIFPSSQQTDQGPPFSPLLLEPPSSISGPPFPFRSHPPLSEPSLQVVETEFLQVVSIRMRQGTFHLHELFLAFPMAVRIWSGVSCIGGAVARLGFKSASIAAEVLRKHGEHAEPNQFGQYHLYAELEDEEDEWWKTKGTQTWQSIRYFWGTKNGE